MAIFRTIRSGSGRVRSIESRPFERSAPITSIPSASRKALLELACGDAAVEELARLVVDLAAAHHELTFLQHHIELIPGEPGHRESDA